MLHSTHLGHFSVGHTEERRQIMLLKTYEVPFPNPHPPDPEPDPPPDWNA